MVKKKRLLKRDLLLFGETLALFRPSLGILERLEVEEHQASFILAVFLRKEVETVLDIEPRRFGIRINRNEAATSPIAVRESMLDKIKNCPTDAFVVVIFRNGETTDFHRRIGLAALVVRNSAVNPIPERTFFGVIRNLVVQKAEIGDSLLRLTIHKKISDSHKVAKVIFSIVKKEVVQIDIIAVERQDFGIFAKGQKVEG